ncbi:Glycosyl transferase family 2 [Mesorhizobium albiziae]|uniref:Glycosyl transferase family 2 n=1 Tax=Neomesorhizobium albiziae TaxID=335020 RepID=A0A1I3XJY9_9HYPH|nr:glycosyltransferase family 2 protein [Mesorhizobium albiziae]GLS30378.1 hypothetical protein GCM10007937_20860 [Mesorhizobium albiziae]SFK19863.1 Glycosyl transferase family 2 [Mesorhizobium albiziae]
MNRMSFTSVIFGRVESLSTQIPSTDETLAGLKKTVVAPRPAPGTTATVSVVIPCYNYARYLPQAVASTLSQEGVDVEIVIVDDCSTDDSVAVARDLASNHPNIVVIARARNSGPVDTFNEGLARASGEFLVRLDADDLLTPGALQRAVALMRAYPSVGLVYGHPLHFAGNRLPAARRTATRWTIWPGKRWLVDRCTAGVNVITSPEAVMRKSIVDRVGGQKPLAHTHDMEMWLRLSAFSDVAYIHGADQAWHRDHQQSLSARKVDSLRDLLERRDAFETLFSGIAAAIPNARAFHASAMQAIAIDAVELATRQYDHPKPDIALIQQLREIAREIEPEVARIPGWAGLEWRSAVGAPHTCRHPVFFAERAVRGLRGIWRRRLWHRSGI